MNPSASDRDPRGGQPLVWALLGHRTGDNLQIEALADALGWPLEPKRLAWRRRGRWTVLYGRMGPSLAPLAPVARAELAPPWPDLVISAGWRSVPVARWIAGRSGARLVHIGRPRAPLGAFDLVLTTPQYGLPDAPNVLRLAGPLSRLSPDRLARAAEAWWERLAHLPRPRIAVLVGGDAPPLRLTPEAAAELGRRVDALARAQGGSLLIATGPRTGEAAAEVLLARITAPSHSFLWGEEGENPYLGYLALGDAFVVTEDSVSMAHEASLTGKPLHLFELPAEGTPWLRARQWLDRRLRRAAGPVAGVYRALIREGWIFAPRDAQAFHAAMVESGRAVRLGSRASEIAAETGPDCPPGETTIGRAVAAVRALFSEHRA